jgi:hypothetical protein
MTSYGTFLNTVSVSLQPGYTVAELASSNSHCHFASLSPMSQHFLFVLFQTNLLSTAKLRWTCANQNAESDEFSLAGLVCGTVHLTTIQSAETTTRPAFVSWDLYKECLQRSMLHHNALLRTPAPSHG